MNDSNFSNGQVIYASFGLRKMLFHLRAYESITLGKYYERISEIFPIREMQKSMLHFHWSRQFNARSEFITESSPSSLICVTMIYANEVINGIGLLILQRIRNKKVSENREDRIIEINVICNYFEYMSNVIILKTRFTITF